MQGTLAQLADSAFAQRLEEKAAETEAALGVLEQAMDDLDATNKAAAAVLAPPAPPPGEAPPAEAGAELSLGTDLASPPESP